MRISIVCSSVGSSTMTGWKRRSSAASFSMYLRYSSSVVAPMHCSSPRDSGGLRMFAASIAPSAAPAPTSVCSSSMNRIASLVFRSSSMIFLSRSSNSPRYFVPATSEPMSSVRTRLLSRMSGTSPATMRCARPSAIAVLPTPGSPISAGLFFVLRAEDLDDPLDLLLAADDRIELVRARGLGEVDAQRVDGRGLAGALRLLGRAGGRRLGQDADDLVANLVQVDAQALEHARRDALALAHEAQQQVLGADVVVAQPARLVDGELDDPLRPRRQADLADDRPVAAPDDELDRRPDLGQLDVHVLEHARGDALALAHEAEQQVLGADVVVVEPLRFVLRKRQDLARAIRELVEAIHPGEPIRAGLWGQPCGHPSIPSRSQGIPTKRPGRTHQWSRPHLAIRMARRVG